MAVEQTTSKTPSVSVADKIYYDINKVFTDYSDFCFH